jgi:hypothetical protein
MRTLRSLLLTMLVGAAMCANVSAARAEWLTVTNCEMVTIDGHEYGKITFDISNNATGPNFGELFDLNVTPYPNNAAPVPLLSITLPSGWTSMVTGSGYYWHANSPANFVYPGQKLSGIEIVLSQPLACYAFQPGSVLLKAMPTTPYLPVCFACPGVTPASESTWGRIKQTYR